MNDKPLQETDNTPTDKTGEYAGPLAGQRLAKARRAHDISMAEIAKELHLDEPKVQALEENQFEILGAPVFAKGHLRKYAQLVGVSGDDVLADYYQLNRAAGPPPIVGPKREKPPPDIAPGPWIFGFLLVMVLAGLLFWWFGTEQAPGIASTAGVLEPFASDRSIAALDNDIQSSQTSGPQEAAGEEAETVAQHVSPDLQQNLPEVAKLEEPAIALDSAAAENDAVAGGVRVVMTFKGDCWAELTDADGEQLFFGLAQEGQTVIRNGKPPLRALFGDYNNVSVTADGANVPLSPGNRRDNTARVTIESP